MTGSLTVLLPGDARIGTEVQFTAVAARNASTTSSCPLRREATMRISGDFEEPLATAARCENRLAQAFRRIGITIGGEGGRASYADVDALGEPVVVIGPITAKTADRLARVIEAAGNLASTIGRSPRPDEAGETAC